MAIKEPLATEDSKELSTLAEFNDTEYWKDVLQLDAHTNEDALDQELLREAAILGVDIAPSKGHISLCDSTATAESRHARTGSSKSQDSLSTNATSRSSSDGRKKEGRPSLSFADYDRFLDQVQPSMMTSMPSEPAPSLFSVSTRKSYSSIKSNLKSRFRLRRSNKPPAENPNSCVCCRDDFKATSNLHVLSCSHKYCEKCLRVLIQQACTSEDKFPPKCCSQGIPGPVLQTVLSQPEQDLFMSAVQQYTTPWAARIYCPNPTCCAFIPPRTKIDPKNPFTVQCTKCDTQACSICKSSAHEIGQDCPSDWELEAVLKMGEKAGWRRCYKCRTLVELTQGCSHITCRCKAQFCYMCGAVWDPDIGCPNYCTSEEELERRRIEEEARAIEEAAQKLIRDEEERKAEALRQIALQRTATSPELRALRELQLDELERFIGFERKMKWVMWTRHGQAKLDILDKYGDLQAKMRERHAKTMSHLDDRQVAAEMELRATLKQAERSVQIRLRHMEAYCDGLGQGRGSENQARVVTERDLRELGQQYNIRDDLDRLHTAKVNVMREKQAKQMEQLMERQEEEVEKLRGKQDGELDGLEDVFAGEESKFLELFAARRERLKARWTAQGEVARKQLGRARGLEYGPLPEVEWPAIPNREAGGSAGAGGLQGVVEEDEDDYD